MAQARHGWRRSRRRRRRLRPRSRRRQGPEGGASNSDRREPAGSQFPAGIREARRSPGAAGTPAAGSRSEVGRSPGTAGTPAAARSRERPEEARLPESEAQVPLPVRRAKPSQAASRQVPARKPGRTWRRREIGCRSWGTVACPGSSYQSQGTTSMTDRLGSESAGRHMCHKERRPPSSLAIGSNQDMLVTHGWPLRPTRIRLRDVTPSSDCRR